MTSKVEQILKNIFPEYALHFKAYKRIIRQKNSYLYLSGWMRSLEEAKPVDKDGNEIPFMNYPVIKFLQDRLRKEFHLFEFGSGYSTSFYAGLVQTVTSVEHDESWFQFGKERLPENVELNYKEKDIDGDYCRVINAAGCKYDVIVVDGKDRINCIKQSIKALSDRGVILLDDSEREQECVNYLIEKKFLSINFEGLKSNEIGTFETTIFYRYDNCFGI